MGSDLFCFQTSALSRKIFMVNLRNVLLEAGRYHHKESDLFYFTVVLKISSALSRTLYFMKLADHVQCLQKLKQAQKDGLTVKETLSEYYEDKGEVLGEGSFGKVVLYQCKRSQELVAVKTLRKSKNDILLMKD
jgi:hypothetical protein